MCSEFRPVVEVAVGANDLPRPASVLFWGRGKKIQGNVSILATQSQSCLEGVTRKKDG